MTSSTPFITKMSEFITDNKLIEAGDTLVVGFSGGADSTTLLHSLWQLRAVFNFKLVAAHVNYNLRGEDSIADKRFVESFCSKYSISLFLKEVRLENMRNLENTARKIRYDFFNSLTSNYKAAKIALGHNMEDSVETMLLHFMRGSGVSGLRGILPFNRNIIRPILCFQRSEIIQYLQDNGINKWCEDKTNKESVFHRNRVRNQLLPWIQKEFNPNIIQLLYENSIIFRETSEYLTSSAQLILQKAVIERSDTAISLDLNQIKSKDRALLFYLFKEIICSITGTDSGFYQNHLKEIISFLNTEGTKVLNLNNDVKVIKEYSVLTFTSDNLTDVIEKTDTEQTLELTKKYQLFDNRRIVLDKLNIAKVKKDYFIGHNEALLDSDKIVMPITVGYRQPGDKFIPLGMTGMKKLKDFFIDEKINKFDRDKIFVFRDSEKIIWIGGKRIDDRVKIDNETQNVLVLRIEEVKTRKSRTAQRKKQ